MFVVSCFTSNGALLLSCHSNQRKCDFDNDFLGPSCIRKKKITGKAKKEMAGKTSCRTTLKAMARANIDEDGDTDDEFYLKNDKPETPKKKWPRKSKC